MNTCSRRAPLRAAPLRSTAWRSPRSCWRSSPGCCWGCCSRRRRPTSAPVAAPVEEPAGEAAPPSSVEVIDALPVAIAVVAGDDRVVLANRSAVELGVVRGERLIVPELRRLVQDVRRGGEAQEVEVEPARTRLVRVPEAVRVRVAPVLGAGGHVAMAVEDVTESRRVDAVRRDFVANVSHELKTPVGAMSLLAEAMLDASEDPSAVRRFAGRLQHEAGRLARLVQELIDLSRLQGAEPLPDQELVAVDRVRRRGGRPGTHGGGRARHRAGARRRARADGLRLGEPARDRRRQPHRERRALQPGAHPRRRRRARARRRRRGDR